MRFKVLTDGLVHHLKYTCDWELYRESYQITEEPLTCLSCIALESR